MCSLYWATRIKSHAEGFSDTEMVLKICTRSKLGSSLQTHGDLRWKALLPFVSLGSMASASLYLQLPRADFCSLWLGVLPTAQRVSSLSRAWLWASLKMKPRTRVPAEAGISPVVGDSWPSIVSLPGPMLHSQISWVSSHRAGGEKTPYEPHHPVLAPRSPSQLLSHYTREARFNEKKLELLSHHLLCSPPKDSWEPRR